MQGREIFRCAADVLLYIIGFYLVQFVVTLVATQFCGSVLEAIAPVMAISGALTIALFLLTKTASLGLDALGRYHWRFFAAVALLGLGLLLPSEWINEGLGLDLEKEDAALAATFEALLRQPVLGFVGVAVLAPLSEELVLRGAVLRRLLQLLPQGRHWWAIVASALIFGLVHGNFSQGVHATLMGVLMGWLYYKTRSILPGAIVHLVNNSVAFVVAQQVGGSGSLNDIFHDNRTALLASMALSLALVAGSFVAIVKMLRKTPANP